MRTLPFEVLAALLLTSAPLPEIDDPVADSIAHPDRLASDLERDANRFLVVNHHAQEGAGIDEGKRLHRVEAALVEDEVTAAGFVLEAESFVLTDPEDERDWNVFDRSHAGRDTTSRFCYLFRKSRE